ncbi:P-loop NTPase [Flavobacterium sp. KACC 22763]|uniref:P-loop NTPase n=1 Tax=Flavobacterium sp. KACC 22763 TaxID=3025668 RepID=UPI002366677F|nr:dsDNA nuclease domain-containing protein [Flavobacterium sp. KACC 22763]WDF66125.1 dsDNA nuclease domain-containing protein [Flavobacterium sp. KACC 22763]
MQPQNKKIKTLDIMEDLNTLLKKRNGGAVNFRGIHYQVLYSCHLILDKLKEPAGNEKITLEGIEDIDLTQTSLTTSSSEFIQLKSSDNKLNAGDFWNWNILQNFLQTYLADSSSSFRLVYNFQVSDGALKQLFENKLTSNSLKHWESKIASYYKPSFNIEDFLSRISYEKISFDEITNSITTLLIKFWNVNIGTERQFINALLNNILQWSKERATISHQNVRVIFEDVRDSYSKAVKNEAVKNNWIEQVNYSNESPSSLLNYYDGKSAKPYHISNGLPARRKLWEKEIIQAVKTNDVVLIRSSSGQGKSTLAWQTGYTLREKRNIYQLHITNNWEQANSVMEFLHSRVLIGEFPIVIIDGLDAEVDHWQKLVQRTSLLPVQYIITSRHEDWIRYGGDISTISLQPIDISIGKEEAEDIFNQFKQKGKLHPEIKEWQPVWEQVLEKGLLIEYTYLLTRGEMISQRLESQIKKLKDDRSPAAKTEILRIVSAADCLQLKIETKNLVRYIEKSVTFANQDRGEVLNELQNEYFLNFDGKNIEGLHPIRSNHLLHLLHNTLAISDTFINLYQLLQDSDKQNFFQNAALLIKKEESFEFYNNISEILSHGTYMDMLHALNGVSHTEPQKYWLENQQHFDEAFKIGALDLFVMHTIPGKQINTYDDLLKVMPSQFSANMTRQRDLLKNLSKYDFKGGDINYLATALIKKINSSNSFKPSYVGLGHLAKWFIKLDLKLTIPFDTNFLSENLKNLPIEEAVGLFQYAFISNPPLYENYVLENKQNIINFLRKNTESLRIEENDNHIDIHFIWDGESSKTTVNQSMNRIEYVYNFLPYYLKYNTHPIILPFPTEEIIRVTRSDATKSISPEIVPDSSEASYSNIWIETISRNYYENSAFEWQKKNLQIRAAAIEWCKSALRIIDSSYEGNKAKRDKETEIYVQASDKLNNLLTPVKPYPKYANTMPDKDDLKKAEKSINSWLGAIRNSNSQFVNLFNPKGENDQYVASNNFKSIFLKLTEMQASFHDIEKLTAVYFDTLSVDKDENIIYERLYKSITYLMNHFPFSTQIPVKVGRLAIENWYTEFITSEMSQLKQILEAASLEIGYDFIMPKRINKMDSADTVVIGIKDFDFTKENNIFLLAYSLRGLADYPAYFFSIVSIQDNIAISGFRFKKDFFEILNDFDDTKFEDLNLNLPLPIIPDHEHADLLNVEIRKQATESTADLKYRILLEVWKLSQARSILSSDEIFDKEWLEELEHKHLETVEKNIKLIPESKINNSFINWYYENCNSKKLWSDQDIISKIIEAAQQEINQPQI